MPDALDSLLSGMPAAPPPKGDALDALLADVPAVRQSTPAKGASPRILLPEEVRPVPSVQSAMPPGAKGGIVGLVPKSQFPQPAPDNRTNGQVLRDFLLSPPEPVQKAVAELNQIMVGPFQIEQKALIEPAASMTSPAGVGLTLASAGIGAAAASSSARLASAGKAADAALSTWFAGESAKNVVKSVPSAYENYKQGDYWGALGELGSAGTSAFLGTVAALHAKGQLSDVAALAAAHRALEERFDSGIFRTMGE